MLHRANYINTLVVLVLMSMQPLSRVLHPLI